MKPFTVERLRKLKDYAQLHQAQSTRFIAGGTNLVDLMKLQVEVPEQLIDLSQMEDCHQLQETAETLHIGSLVTNTELARFAAKSPDWQLLAQAVLSGATVQLRNRATTGGNLLQRTRCYYFYDTSKPCNKRAPGSGCAAIGGFNRHHAVLGTSDQCIAAHPSDMAVAMIALDATVHTLNPQGQVRQIPLRKFYRLPADTPHLENQLQTDELITHVSLPKADRGVHLYRKVRDRQSYAFALVSVACAIKIKQGKVARAHLALGGVGTKPWHAHLAEETLINQTPTRALLQLAASSEVQQARGSGYNDFKVAMLERTLFAVLRDAIAKQGGLEEGFHEH